MVLLLVSQILIGAQVAATVPGLGPTRGMVAVESAAAASNVIPGPSGTATRLAVLRSWGFYTEDFARSWLFTSSLTNFTVLVMPAVAVVLVAVDNDVPGAVFALAAVALVVSAVASGSWCASSAASASPAAPGCWPGGRRWPPPRPGATRPTGTSRRRSVGFRNDLRTSWKTLGTKVTLAVVGTYVTTGVIFALSLRATGLDRDELAIGAIAVVYTVVRLLTIVNFTPGGVGVTGGPLRLGPAHGDRRGVRIRRSWPACSCPGLTYIGPILPVPWRCSSGASAAPGGPPACRAGGGRRRRRGARGQGAAGLRPLARPTPADARRMMAP